MGVKWHTLRLVTDPANSVNPPLRLGISSCLLGEMVRYDGGHKRDRVLIEELGPFVEWVPVCPELESGLSVPRPAMHLLRDGKRVRLVEVESGRDHTERMERFAARRVPELRELGLDGCVLKKGSPSCGVTQVELRDPDGGMRREGRGLFAQALLDACPGLPVEQEDQLADPELRARFLERARAYRGRR